MGISRADVAREHSGRLGRGGNQGAHHMKSKNVFVSWFVSL